MERVSMVCQNLETSCVEMNVCKRKSDECHYCANQKRHDRKRSRITTDSNSELTIMATVQGNFKCRGRGGKEIEFLTNDEILTKDVKKSKSADSGQSVISQRNHDHGQKMNFKPRPKRTFRNKTDRPKCENRRSGRLSRSDRADISGTPDSKHEIRQPSVKLEHVCSSVDDLSTESKISRPESVRSDVSQLKCNYLSLDQLSLLGPKLSDGGSSSDGSSISTYLTRSRNSRKTAEDCKRGCKNLKSTSGLQTKTYRNTLTEGPRSLRTSNESVHDYLTNVSEELQRERLLGKLDQTDQQRKKSDEWSRNRERPDEGGDRLKVYAVKNVEPNSTYSSNCPDRTRKFQQAPSAKSSSTVTTTRRTETLRKIGSFWARMFQLLSLGCWKTDINSNSPSDDEKSELNTVSECEGSSSSESSSTSTGTTTVAAVTDGRLSATTRNDGAKSTRETQTTKIPSSRSSSTGDHKLVAAKLVKSLKRFFSRQGKADTDRTPKGDNEPSSDSSSTAESNSEPSSSAPLNPKQHSFPKQSAIERIQKDSTVASRNHRIKPSPESQGSNKQLLGDPAGSPLSTENEMSDAEIVDICPMHKQPM